MGKSQEKKKTAPPQKLNNQKKKKGWGFLKSKPNLFIN